MPHFHWLHLSHKQEELRGNLVQISTSTVSSITYTIVFLALLRAYLSTIYVIAIHLCLSQLTLLTLVKLFGHNNQHISTRSRFAWLQVAALTIPPQL